MAIKVHFTFSFFFLFTMSWRRMIQINVVEGPLTGNKIAEAVLFSRETTDMQ